MFRVSTLDLANLPRTPEGKVDFAQDFFGREAFLTVSGQLNVQWGIDLQSEYERFLTEKHPNPGFPLEAVIQFPNLAPRSRPSFPRKRESRDFSRLLLGPRFRGHDEFGCPQDLLTLLSRE